MTPADLPTYLRDIEKLGRSRRRAKNKIRICQEVESERLSKRIGSDGNQRRYAHESLAARVRLAVSILTPSSRKDREDTF